MIATREWDAVTYDRVGEPMFEWGLEVLNRLHLRGDETVVDAGCGTGRVTAALAARLPRGRIVAVDGSRAMIEQAAGRLRPQDSLIHADLLDLDLDEPVDLVFSNATFHWIPDHERLFERLHAALRPRARLVAQCGGTGNLGSLREVLADVGCRSPYADRLSGYWPWNFAAPEATAALLGRTRFTAVRCWLETKLARPADPRGLLQTAVLGNHLDRLPADMRESFTDDVMAASRSAGLLPEGRLELPYVRLNIEATA